ncbi:MAG: hypothetical protein F4X25_06280 [Chloroflexi bacterium]|nr:hypothetical protein [Chloroflexota bacterium]
MAQTADESYELARAHLERVQVSSWGDPVDWADLSMYGFYCLEACVVAAALHLGQERPSGHREKVETADSLAAEQNLPDIWDLLRDLNDMRKHEAYGDVDPPEGLDAEEVAGAIEEYVDSVGALLQS